MFIIGSIPNCHLYAEIHAIYIAEVAKGLLQSGISDAVHSANWRLSIVDVFSWSVHWHGRPLSVEKNMRNMEILGL